MAEPEWIHRAREWDQVDPILERDLMAAVLDGATLRQQAMAAGISFADYKTIRALGKDGVPPFARLFSDLERARYEVLRPGTLRKKEIMQHEDATLSEIDTVAARLTPEDYPERQVNPTAGAGGMTLNINVQKQFEPYPAPQSLPDPNVVDGELAE